MQNTARLSRRLRSVEAMDATPQPDAFTVRMAVSAAERAEAARLVVRLYGAEGYLDAQTQASLPLPAMPVFSIHHLLDEAVVFTVWQRQRLVGALTVIQDSPASLPMDALYGGELDALRQQGRRLCEFCSLALEPDLDHSANGALLELFRAAYRFVTYAREVTDVCVTLKPTHAPFYRRICFQPVGGQCLDARFSNAETIAMRLPHEPARELWAGGAALRPALRLQAFFSKPLSAGEKEAWSFRAQAARRGGEELEACLAAQPRLLAGASLEQQDYLHRQLAARAECLLSASII